MIEPGLCNIQGRQRVQGPPFPIVPVEAGGWTARAPNYSSDGDIVPLIDKERLPRVDLDSMNEVHLEEVDIVNELSDLLDAYDGDESAIPMIGIRFEELIEHTKAHFASEERLMVDGGFPPFPMHRGEHERQLERVATVYSQWTSSQDVDLLREFVQRELPEWVMNHILTMDTVTAQYLAASGQMPSY
jgi:hemerythrin